MALYEDFPDNLTQQHHGFVTPCGGACDMNVDNFNRNLSAEEEDDSRKITDGNKKDLSYELNLPLSNLKSRPNSALTTSVNKQNFCINVCNACILYSLVRFHIVCII